MPELIASRTLVKSAPELWAECSDAGSLAKHLGAFGEITITKLEPEIAVAWEGNAARGTVRLEPAGWGTKVMLTATETVVAEPVAEPVVAAGGVVVAERPSLLQRVFRKRPRRASTPAVAEPEPAAPPPVHTGDALDAALDSLGRAHHRPYSRG